VVFVVAGLGALRLLNPDFVDRAEDAVAAIVSPFMRGHLERLLARLTGMRPWHLRALGIGAFFYAGLFTVEGVGLWMEKRWAEFLTVIATASFVPFEAWELSRQITAVRLLALISNVAIVIYLVQMLRHTAPARDRA
jgi:uncharacterized membrane protein (DUF2068 family)